MNDAIPPTIDRGLPGSLDTRLEGIRREHGVGAVRLSIRRCNVSTRQMIRMPSVPVRIAGVLVAAIQNRETLMDPVHGCIDNGRTRTLGAPVQGLPGGNRVGR